MSRARAIFDLHKPEQLMAAQAPQARAPNIDTTVAELRKLYGDRVSTAHAVREQHGKDISFHEAHLPDAVVFAESTEEVQQIVQLCARLKTPIIAFGTGTSLEGHISAPNGGISLDVSRMNNVLAVNEADLDVVVQPGVTRKQLNEYIRATGLFFPIDPGADASLGGMTSTRASGTNAVRYGTMRENVLALQVVTADGRLMRLGRRARKSSAGYDLVKLFVGSEGTLGVITEITLRLYGIPESMVSATCAFDSLEGAVNTVIQTIQSGIPVARIELMDTYTVDTVNKYSKLSLPAKNLLLLEFHGTEAGTKEQAEMVQAIAAAQGRHDAAWAAKAAKPGWGMWATDVCVPISKLAECILETQKDIEKNGLYAPIVGHVGDGNFHLTMMVDPDDPTYLKRAEGLNDRMVARALALGGTCTGEHGVGIGKIKFLYEEHGEAMSLMRSIKKALDPDNIMNPGKIIGPIN
jgi:D-lactate dehydrogenase (cytochrome)